MKWPLLYLAFLVSVPFHNAYGQINFEWCATQWSDSYVEWNFYYDLDSINQSGNLQLRWLQKNDWSKWDFRFGEESGDIFAPWPDQVKEWVLRTPNKRVAMTMRWPNDLSEWRIGGNDKTLLLKAVNPNLPEEWEIVVDDTSFLQIYTEVEGDIRSWIFYEEGLHLDPEIKLAAFFLVMYSTVPHY